MINVPSWTPDEKTDTRIPLLLSQTSLGILVWHMEKIVSGDPLQDDDVVETKLWDNTLYFRKAFFFIQCLAWTRDTMITKLWSYPNDSYDHKGKEFIMV